MPTIISSQRYLDDDILDQKIADRDFEVQLSPVFEVDGEKYQVIMDGHHSYHATKAAGVEPNYYIQTVTENDRIALLDQDIEFFLEACYIDSDWYDITTGVLIW